MVRFPDRLDVLKFILRISLFLFILYTLLLLGWTLYGMLFYHENFGERVYNMYRYHSELISSYPIKLLNLLPLENLNQIRIILFHYVFNTKLMLIILVMCIIISITYLVIYYKKYSSTIKTGFDENGKSFRIKISEFKQGGLIAGAIGTGKTTLRLNIMKQLMKQEISILDIDYKGDAPKMKKFRKKGVALVAGKNLHIDIFKKPDNITEKEFVDVLFRSFLETITDSEITSPQKMILYEALRKTVAKRGNLQSFYKNIVLVGYESKEVIENRQQQSSIALVNKFIWLQNNMGSVFSVTGQSIDPKFLIEKNIFLDLSFIQNKASINHIRFLIDILITQIMHGVHNVDSHNFTKKGSKIKKIIFIDEAHLLIPKSKSSELTKLEELVATLRYKGLSVIATTTDINFISPVLHDSSFIAQFRTNTISSNRSVYTKYELAEISNLQNYNFYLKCEKTKYENKLNITLPIHDTSDGLNAYLENIPKYNVVLNKDFMLNSINLKLINLEGLVFDSLLIEPLRDVVKGYASNMYSAIVDTNLFLENDVIYQNTLYQSCFKFLESDTIPSIHQTNIILRGYLLEILFLCIEQNFKQITNHRKPVKQKNEFHRTYQEVFLRMVNFIDVLISQEVYANPS